MEENATHYTTMPTAEPKEPTISLVILPAVERVKQQTVGRTHFIASVPSVLRFHPHKRIRGLSPPFASTAASSLPSRTRFSHWCIPEVKRWRC